MTFLHAFDFLNMSTISQPRCRGAPSPPPVIMASPEPTPARYVASGSSCPSVASSSSHADENAHASHTNKARRQCRNHARMKPRIWHTQLHARLTPTTPSLYEEATLLAIEQEGNDTPEGQQGTRTSSSRKRRLSLSRIKTRPHCGIVQDTHRHSSWSTPTFPDASTIDSTRVIHRHTSFPVETWCDSVSAGHGRLAHVTAHLGSHHRTKPKRREPPG